MNRTIDSKIEKFIQEIVSEWTGEDFENTSFDDLYYHINQWMEETGNELDDMFLAKFDFENWMGW